MSALTRLRTRGWDTTAMVALLLAGIVLVVAAAVRASLGGASIVASAAGAALLALVLIVTRQRRARSALEQAIGEVSAAARDAARGKRGPGLTLGAGGPVDELAAAVAALIDRASHASPLSDADLATVATMPVRASRAVEVTLEDLRLQPGELFAGRYEILEMLGRSDVRTAYRVRDRESGDLLVLKTLHPGAFGGDAGGVAQFKADLRVVRRLAHPNILRTYDFGEAEQYYVTMELVEATPVHDLLERHGRLDVATTLSIAVQASRGLAVAHRERVLHRDVRPQSLLLDASGLLKVADFGLATTAQRTRALVRTANQPDVAAYVPPEVLRSEPVDVRSDLYSLAVVLYRCVAGRLPEAGRGDAPVEPLSALDPAVPAALSDLVAQTLSPRPEARPASADVFRNRLALVTSVAR